MGDREVKEYDLSPTAILHAHNYISMRDIVAAD